VVELIEAYNRPPVTEPGAGALERAGRNWSQYAPWLLVGFAVAFGAWLLRPELRAVPYPNDASVHQSLVRFAEMRIRGGHNPFDSWYPYLGLGSPQFSQYQSLSHIVVGLFSIPFGDSLFRQTDYLLLATWPIPVYAGARLLGLGRWEAATAALLSPMLVNVTGYGFEWGSFVWLGSGMWSMLWALWLLPLALGLAWRAISRHERVALAAFVVGLTCALHFITGYLVLLALGVFVLVQPPEFLKRLGRAALVGVGGLAIFAFVFVPTVRDVDYVNIDAFQAGTFWVNSYGPGKVFGWLVQGEVFDFGRLPVVTLLVGVGAVVCCIRSRRGETERALLGLMILSLALYSGHRVVGPVIDHLPGGENLLLHRYVIGVHLAGLFIAGVGAVWAVRKAAEVGRALLRVRYGPVVAGVIVAAVAIVVLLPVLNDRKGYAEANRFWIDAQTSASATTGRDIDALIDIAKDRGDGRVYAGASGNWGAQVKLEQVPLYQLPVQRGADSLGFYLRTNSLSANVEPYFNDSLPEHYDLFNVKYVILPGTRAPVVPATLITTRGDYSLWQVATGGYLDVVDTTEAVNANSRNMAAVMTPWLASPAVAQSRHPLVAFSGASTPAPSLSNSAPFTGPPGNVTWSEVSYADGRFSGGVHATRPAWVMLKESYSPRWTAHVDGEQVDTAMVTPSFVGLPVPAGDHIVVFEYRPISSYPLLFLFGVLVLAALAFGPAWLRRLRARSARPGSAAPASPAG
jgi:hypothetical protein